MISNRGWWEANKARYPFHAKGYVGCPRPEDLKAELVAKGYTFDFIGCPVGNGDYMWGFLTAEDRIVFRRLHPGTRVGGSLSIPPFT